MLEIFNELILSFYNLLGPVGSQIVQSGIFVLAAFIIAMIVRSFLKNNVKKVAGKTKTDLDDWIIHIITKPIFIGIILGGIYLSARNLSIFAQYKFYLNGGFFIIYALIGAWVVSKITSLFVAKGLKVKKRFEKTPQLLNKIISVIIYTIALLMIESSDISRPLISRMLDSVIVS